MATRTKPAMENEMEENTSVPEGGTGETEAGQNGSCTGATGPDEVEIELFRDNGRYRDDVVVGLNGKLYVIKRGVRVKVPRAVWEILDHSREQDTQTAIMMDSLEQKYMDDTARYKI